MTAGAVVALVVLSGIAPPVAAQSDPAPTIVVELAPDGSAQVIAISTVDLTTESDRQAFRTLENDEQARADATDRFHDRLRTVARDAQNATGREMAVTDVTLDLGRTTDGGTGVVTFSATWTALAAETDGTLVLTEPFTSGFTADRQVVVRAPDGYDFSETAPAPDSAGDGRATWDAGTDLAGFTVQASPTADAEANGAATDGQPGFGVLGAAVAMLVAAGVARRNDR